MKSHKPHEDSLYAWQAQLAINLYSVGRNWMGIDSLDADSLRRTAQYDVASGYMAGGLSTLMGKGYVTWPIPFYDSSVFDSVMNDTTVTGNRMANSGNAIQPVSTDTKPLFSIAPNPTYGTIAITTSRSGIFALQSIDGKEIEKYELTTGGNSLQFPVSLSPGIYIGFVKK